MKKPNIIFIVVDALRASNLSCYGYPTNTSPFLDQLAAKGVLFENCFSCTNASDPALTSLMSGMYTRTHGIMHHSYEVNDQELKTFEERKVKLLQEILKEHKYKTFALDFLARWHSRGYDYYPPLKIDRTKRKRQLNKMLRFFDTLHLKPLFKKIHHTKTFRRFFGGFDAYPKDTETTAKALELIAEHKGKKEAYFLFLHYWGVHKPYICPKEENKLSTQCYNNAIETVDAHLSKVFAAAGEDAVVVIVGDHGESLGEHGISFDHHGLYEASMHVPLIFAGPGVPKGKKINGLACTTDIFATLLALAGIKYAPKTDSCNLVPLMKEEKKEVREYVFAEENYYQDKACIRTKTHKFIKTIGNGLCGKCHLVHGADQELYDLQKDPQELQNIAAENFDLLTKFTTEIEKYIK